MSISLLVWPELTITEKEDFMKIKASWQNHSCWPQHWLLPKPKTFLHRFGFGTMANIQCCLILNPGASQQNLTSEAELSKNKLSPQKKPLETTATWAACSVFISVPLWPQPRRWHMYPTPQPLPHAQLPHKHCPHSAHTTGRLRSHREPAVTLTGNLHPAPSMGPWETEQAL